MPGNREAQCPGHIHLIHVIHLKYNKVVRQMIQRSYDYIMQYASHPKAVWVMNLVSFVESSFFPLPPDPLYIAMILKNRNMAWRYATMCTISSVLGGLLGYWIGYALYESFGLWIIETYGLEESFKNFQAQFNEWGFWVIALKGLTPIPYKIVTISCGLAAFDLKTFIVASIIARGFRFFLVAGLLWRFGEPIKTFIDQNLKLLLFSGLGALVGGFLLFKYIF